MPFARPKKLYYGNMYPYFAYSVCAWGATHKRHLQALILLQKRVNRLLGKSAFLAHTIPLFKTINTLKHKIPINAT